MLTFWSYNKDCQIYFFLSNKNILLIFFKIIPEANDRLDISPDSLSSGALHLLKNKVICTGF